MDESAQEVVARELLLLSPGVRQDPVRVLALLHPDFEEYGSSGRIWNRSSIMAATGEVVVPLEAADVAAHRLGPDVFLVTYRSEQGERVTLRSSTWLRHGGEWLLRFHQGTPAFDP